jgi:hypothetical protein
MRARLNWWHYLGFALLLIQVSLFAIPQTRPGLFGAVCWYSGSDRVIWLGVAGLLFLCAILWSAWQRPFWTRWRVGGYAMLVALACSPLAFRAYPSSYDDAPSQVRFRLPLDGPVTVGWGGATPDVNYHVVAADQRWAYDLLVTKEGISHQGDGTKLQDYYAYGLPVLAPADGTVRSVGQLGGTPACGNHIVLEVASGQFVFLCHLQPGSITVKEGQAVRMGQALARVGNSGNTSEPHLHIHLQDTPEDTLGEGIPLYFHSYRDGDVLIERGIPMGGVDKDGQFHHVIEHVATKPKTTRPAE